MIGAPSFPSVDHFLSDFLINKQKIQYKDITNTAQVKRTAALHMHEMCVSLELNLLTLK